jgi:hypothetical protein
MGVVEKVRNYYPKSELERITLSIVGGLGLIGGIGGCLWLVGTLAR